MNENTVSAEIPGIAIVIGANGGIANALITCLLADPLRPKVLAVSRAEKPVQFNSDERLLWHQLAYDESAIQGFVIEFGHLLESSKNDYVDRVFICHGILHNESIRPEKRLEDLSADNMQTVFAVNTILPVLWLKHLIKVLKSDKPCYVAVLSARVGSIGDNRMGGWYSYRASKSALNMLLKTAAIEYARRATNVKLIAFHPGTTDTALSRPFQKNVPAKKLFTPDFVAERLMGLMPSHSVDGALAYIDWDNQAIVW